LLRYKALQILRTYSDDDSKKFKLFLESPYFNTSKKVAQLYNILLKFHPEFESQKLTNRFLKKKINTSSDSTLKNLFADLFHLCEKYLATNRFLTCRNNYSQMLAEELIFRNLREFSKDQILKLESSILNTNDFHREDFLSLFNIENMKYELDIFNHNVKNADYSTNLIEAVTKANKFLFYHYLLNSVDIHINILTQSGHLLIEPKKTEFGKFFDDLFNNKKLHDLFNDKFIISNSLYKDIAELNYLNLLIRKGIDLESNFIKYIEILTRTAPRLHIDEKYNFFSSSSYFFPYVLEHPEFIETEFKFYDLYLKNEGWKNTGNNYMTIRQFKYFYTRGDTTKNYEWTDRLMTEYIVALAPEYRESIIALRNAYVLIRRDKKFTEAICELNKVCFFDEHDLKRDVKYLNIIAYFENKEYERARQYIERLNKFLRREDAPAFSRTQFTKFTKEVCKLIRHKTGEHILDLGEYKMEIEKALSFPSKPWLIEKIEEELVQV
jgi:hypothetical protein